MLYDYQYTIAGLLATLVLLVVNLQRRGYLYSKSNQVFMSLIYCNLLSGGFDLATFWTISYPGNYSLAFDYGTNILYLLFYSALAATFLRYIAVIVGGKKLEKLTLRIYLAAILVQAVLLVTTPWTHFIIYYDQHMVYMHGPLMWLMYAIPYGCLLGTILLVVFGKKKFNSFQIRIVIMLYTFMVAYSLVQIRFRRIDVGCLAYALVLFVIYMVFENPAYYTYKQTRCLNRRAFHEEAERLAKKDKEKVCLYLITLTNRPPTGSIHAEFLLEDLRLEVANRLSKAFGSSAYCISKARFTLVFQNDRLEEEKICQKVENIFSEPVFSGEKSIHISWKIRRVDFASLAVSDDFVDHLVESIRLLTDKELFETEDVSALLLHQHQYRLVEDAVLKAIEKDSFEVYYQPIYSLEGADFHSAEALVRLKDDRLGQIPPSSFIPVAEKNGSILGVGECVFKKVCSFIARHPLKELGLKYIEVNLSMVQLMQTGLAERFIAIAREAGVNPSLINIEVTESVELVSNMNVLKNIEYFTKAGIRFSIDDFGSGFASSGYLFRLPFDLVKIDKSMLWSAVKNPAAMTVFAHTMELVHALDKEIVVEGIENQHMADLVAENKGEFIQGYYYSRPLAEEDFLAFLTKMGKT